MGRREELEYKLKILKERLEEYKFFLEEALRKNDDNLIVHWKNNIRGLENEISGLEYELNH